MITASVYLDRWGRDDYPTTPTSFHCNIERIEAIQKDAMQSILAMIVRALQNHAYPSVREEMASLAIQVERAIDDTFGHKNPDPDPLPSVAGRMQMSHEAFQTACREVIRNLNQCSDNAVLQVLCEAVRCSRECCDLSSQLQAVAARVLEKAKS